MPPARVKGHLEVWISRARGLGDEVGNFLQPREIDSEMRQPVIEADREHAVRTPPHRVGAQKRQSGSRV
jgi:hypothetical protein